MKGSNCFFIFFISIEDSNKQAIKKIEEEIEEAKEEFMKKEKQFLYVQAKIGKLKKNIDITKIEGEFKFFHYLLQIVI